MKKTISQQATEGQNGKSIVLALFANSKTWTTAFLIFFLTAALAALDWYGYQRYPTPYHFELIDLTQFIHNPFWLGHSLQTTLLPMAFLYALSQTRLFQRAISNEMTWIDKVDFTAILILFQMVSITFEITITHAKAFGQLIGVILQAPGYVLLIPIVGSLLFGWKVGLILGLETWLLRGTYDVYFRIPPFDFYRWEDLASLVSFVSWKEIILSGFVFNTWAITPMWVGIISGLLGERMSGKKFSPTFLIPFVTVIFVIAGLFNMFGRGNYAVIEWIPSTLTTGLGILFAGLMIGNAQANQAQRKAEAAELAAARAELRALRAQISPHFLFNALNTIRYFIRTNPTTARQLLLDLSQILQRSLRFEQFTSLQEELDYVRSYLTLEKARFNDRLNVIWDLDIDDYVDCLVPVLILQPLVENAVIHGISPKPNGGEIRISVSHTAENIVLAVVDDGIGIELEKLNDLFSPSTVKGNKESIGVRNVNSRLKVLYGDQYALSIESEVGKGTHVQFSIPICREEKS